MGDASLPARAAEAGEAESPVTLTVFAATSLAGAFGEIEQAFEVQNEGVDVVLNLAGSQQLAQQLRLGAPADVFASADVLQMEVALSARRVEAHAPVIFARNRLVTVVPRNNPAGLTRLQDLTREGLRIVLADDAVPAGRYARRFLRTASKDSAFGADFGSAVLARVVSFEASVRAVLTKVALGEADAGIVYESDLVDADPTEVARIEIPDRLNPVARYPIAPLVDSEHPELAAAFVAFVCSPDGRAILTRYGFAAATAS